MSCYQNERELAAYRDGYLNGLKRALNLIYHELERRVPNCEFDHWLRDDWRGRQQSNYAAALNQQEAARDAEEYRLRQSAATEDVPWEYRK